MGDAWRPSDASAVGRPIVPTFLSILAGKSCEVFLPPFDGLFADDIPLDDVETIVEPDLVVVCEPDRVGRTIQVFRPTPAGRHDRGELLEKSGLMASREFSGLTIDLERHFQNL